MHSDLDVIPVRTDEQFNYQAMQTYLHTHVAHAEGTLEVQQFGEGEMYADVALELTQRVRL